ncbi:enoyl-CoA hydratase/isomerase family protein [Pueribacillus theae]|uniref:Enoyl-CoA hydratase/isomerase family protein n=1 Tax=Pueribacillus theae TaxID=2171751 RepID=A0A2U1JW55_9BACI|nr:enoyl-CoA hydratase/isomerase family protein [Pueribacillus theae]PWA09437.1 enoyl-CoA hydratase/isomerase family protein [Pueribacillus theae]
MSDLLKVQKENGIAYLTMNRPDKLNALSKELVTFLIRALKDAEADEEIRAIILSGEGKSFCSGGDIGNMGGKMGPAQTLSSIKETSALTKTIVDLDKYVVSAVRGYAAGAGFSLALASDFIISDRGAKFVSSFKNIGLVPDLGLIKLLTERVPLPIAKEWISSGKNISAEEAYTRGVINRIAETDVVAEAADFAQFIIDGPPIANQFVKYQTNRANELSFETSMMQENIIQSLMFQTNDTKEGVTAFMEKRNPNFTGK